MKNNKLTYEKIIEDGSIQYKITIESILGGLYGNILKNNQKVHTEEISQLVYLGLVKKFGKEYPFKYLKNSLKKQTINIIRQNPDRIIKKILNKLKKEKVNCLFSIKELYGIKWDRFNIKTKNQFFTELKNDLPPNIRIIGSDINQLKLEKKN